MPVSADGAGARFAAAGFGEALGAGARRAGGGAAAGVAPAPGSLLMMLTGGIEDADGKATFGLGTGAAAVAGP